MTFKVMTSAIERIIAKKDSIEIELSVTRDQVVSALHQYMADLVLSDGERENFMHSIFPDEVTDLNERLDRAERELRDMVQAEKQWADIPINDVRRANLLSILGRREDALECLADAASEALGRRL